MVPALHDDRVDDAGEELLQLLHGLLVGGPEQSGPKLPEAAPAQQFPPAHIVAVNDDPRALHDWGVKPFTTRELDAERDAWAEPDQPQRRRTAWFGGLNIFRRS